MNLFYAPESDGDWVELPKDEARHCVQVLRRREGDTIHWVDGKGTLFSGPIVEATKRGCKVTVNERKQAFGKRPFRLHLAIAPTKQMDRLEWFLEKATEIGVDEITLLLCAHSERRKVRIDRLEKILVSAMKQSLKAYLPVLHDLTPFPRFIRGRQTDQSHKFIAYMEARESQHLKNLYPAGGDVCLLIGPEGGFLSNEVEMAQKSGFQPVSLGASRLRTETAGVVACTIANLTNG